MWRQCALMGGHIGATWRIRLNRPSAAARCGFMSNYFDHLSLVVVVLVVVVTAGQRIFDIKPHRAAADGRFNRIRQVAPMCLPMKAYSRHLANTIELVLSLAYPSPQPKRQLDRFSRFCTPQSEADIFQTSTAIVSLKAHSFLVPLYSCKAVLLVHKKVTNYVFRFTMIFSNVTQEK